MTTLTTAERVRIARTEAGLTQAALADLAGVAQADISRIENGRTAPTGKTVDKIMHAITQHLGHPPTSIAAVDGTLGIRAREVGVLNAVDVLGDAPDVQWVIDGLVARNAVTMLAAAPGTGKSLIAQALGVAIATADPDDDEPTEVGPFTVRGGTVVILDAENGEALIQRRARGMGLTEEAVEAGRYRVFEAEGFDIEADVQALREVVDATRPDLLVCDTWVSLWAGSESSTDAVKRCLNGLRDIAEEYDVGILLLHHTTKGADTYRGSSAIAGTIEAVFMMLRDENGSADERARILTCDKMRLDAEPRPRRFVIDTRGVANERDTPNHLRPGALEVV